MQIGVRNETRCPGDTLLHSCVLERCPQAAWVLRVTKPLNVLDWHSWEGMPAAYLPLKSGLGGGWLAQGLGIGLFAFGGAYWPLATAHPDPLWVRTCFGCVNGAPG